MDINAFIGPVASAIVTGVVTGVGVYVAMSNRIAILETKMDNLVAKVEKHNSVVERVAVLEHDNAAHERDVSELFSRLREHEIKTGGTD